MLYSQGDIVLVDFPFTHQMNSKLRPVVVVSNADVNITDDVIVAAVTSAIRSDHFSFELKNDDVTISLRKPCEVRCHKLATLEQSKIIKRISVLRTHHLKDLLRKVRAQFSSV